MREYPKPRVYSQPNRHGKFLWHGFEIKPGMIYGRDKWGYYVTLPCFEAGIMCIHRPVNGCWVDVIETPTTSETVAYIVRNMFTKKFHRTENCRVVRDKTGAKRIVSSERLRESAANKEGSLRLFKGHGIGKGLEFPSMSESYRDSSRQIYGQTVEMSGKVRAMSPAIISYMDGTWK